MWYVRNGAVAGAQMQTTMNMRAKALRTGTIDLERAVIICFTALILPKSLHAGAVRDLGFVG